MLSLETVGTLFLRNYSTNLKFTGEFNTTILSVATQCLQERECLTDCKMTKKKSHQMYPSYISTITWSIMWKLAKNRILNVLTPLVA